MTSRTSRIRLKMRKQTLVQSLDLHIGITRMVLCPPEQEREIRGSSFGKMYKMGRKWTQFCDIYTFKNFDPLIRKKSYAKFVSLSNNKIWKYYFKTKIWLKYSTLGIQQCLNLYHSKLLWVLVCFVNKYTNEIKKYNLSSIWAIFEQLGN